MAERWTFLFPGSPLIQEPWKMCESGLAPAGWAVLGYADQCLRVSPEMNKKMYPVRQVVVQSWSCVWFFATPWTAGPQASLSFTVSRSVLKLTSIESVMPSSHLTLCRPLLLPPSIFPSIRVFSKDLVLRLRWPKFWSFSFSISPSSEYSGLISFRIVWLDLFAVHATLKSLLRHHNLKVQILWCSAFFTKVINSFPRWLRW